MDGGIDLFWRCYGEYRGNPSHFKSYLLSKYKEYANEVAYKMYITDSIFYYMQDKRLNIRYYDIIHQSQQEEERTGDEIALDIITRLKGG
jgi:hypothetical protein